MTTIERDLKALLVEGLAGNSTAYRAFLEKASELLRRFVSLRLARMGRSAQDSEDIVQEALIAIHTKRHTYDGETPVTAWIYGITRYKLIDNLRANSVNGDVIDLDDADICAEGGEQSEARLVIRKLLSRLPDALRRPVELVKLHGLTASEAAQTTGTSEVTVRVNVHRGLKAIQRYCGIDRSDRDADR